MESDGINIALNKNANTPGRRKIKNGKRGDS